MLDIKSTSICIAVICFFALSFIGWFAELEPLICCKRALVGAVIAYVLSKIIVNIVNSIMISALVKFKMKQQGQDANESAN